MDDVCIEVHVNGTSMMIPQDFSVARLLTRLKISGRLAVEINHHIVPRSQFPEHPLRQGDQIEIVHAIGGGAGCSPL